MDRKKFKYSVCADAKVIISTSDDPVLASIYL